MAKKKKEKRAVGWKEHVALPDLKIKSVIAKIDTGANVATIDAANIKFITKNDIKYVKFTVKKRNNTNATFAMVALGIRALCIDMLKQSMKERNHSNVTFVNVALD